MCESEWISFWLYQEADLLSKNVPFFPPLLEVILQWVTVILVCVKLACIIHKD